MTAPVDEVFAALADPTRRAILRSVAVDGPVTATQLAGTMPVSRQAVAKHLGVLDGAGLVEAAREGRETRYRAAPGGLHDARAWIDDVGAAWDRRLRTLERHLDRDPRPDP